MGRQDSIKVIIWGFAIVIALLAIMATIASLQLVDIDQRQARFVQHDAVKSGIFQSMRRIVRERSLSMFALSRAEDAFSIDDEYIHFHALAGDFIELRLQLEAMDLYSEEQRLFEEAKAIIRVTAPLQETIVQKFVDGHLQGVDELLKQDIPLEKQLLAIFDQLVEANQTNLAAAAVFNENAYRRSSIIVILLGGLAVMIAVLVMAHVVHRTRTYQKALQQEKDFAETTLSSIGDAVITADAAGRVTFINPVAQKMLAQASPVAIGQPLANIYAVLTEEGRHSKSHIAFDSRIDGPVSSLPRFHVLRIPSGVECIIEDIVTPMHNSMGEYLGCVIVFRDVTQTRLIEQQLSWQALHDPLTGLANRLQFETRLQEMLIQARRDHVDHAFLMLDLDHFKPVNDNCGHMAGDLLLKQIAGKLQEKMRKSDTLARLGGDEFAILLEGCSLAEAARIADTLRTEIAILDFDCGGKRFNVGASIGVCSVNANSQSLESLMERADKACYAAKREGRNRVKVDDQSSVG